MESTCLVLTSIDWRFVATLGLPAAVVVIGWFLVHRLSAQRDLAIRRREARVRALESAYLRLAISANRPLTTEAMDGIETFVSEIQLYGTPKQIELMTRIVEGLTLPNNPVSFDAILKDLRDTIRAELRLESISGSIWWFRFDRKAPEPPAPEGPKRGSSGNESVGG